MFTRAFHPRCVVVPMPDDEVREWQDLREGDAMHIRRKRRLLMLGGTVCLGELAIGGYLYAQSLGNRQSFRTYGVTAVEGR
jgi:hypothetical protein